MQPFAKNLAVEYAAKALPDSELAQALKDLQEGKTTIEAVTALIEGGTLDGKFNSVNTPALTSENENIEAQKPVVELMKGYSFEPSSTPNIDISFNYVGAVKNGNKLTFVLSFEITRHEGSTSNPTLGFFDLPLSIYNKLMPSAVGGYNFLDCKVVDAFPNHLTSLPVYAYISKHYNRLQVVLNAVSNLATDTTYYCRYEATFLLSDNLAD